MRLISLLLLTTAVTSARAADLASGPVDQRPSDAPDTIVVTADRLPEPVARVGVSISVLDAADIRTRQTDDVVDLLRTVPGVTIARSGGVGAQASVFIRGASSDQSVALIDGVKVNDPSSPGGGFNFGELLTGNIARIEVLRGPSSVLWGSQAIGGVVNIITAPPTDDLQIDGRAEYGYRNTGQFVGNISGKAGPLSASAGAGYFRTDGISAFDERLGGREKDGYRNIGANANLSLALSEAVSVDARGYYSDGRVDTDGFAPPSYAFGDTREYTLSREFIGYGGFNATLFDGRFRNRIGFAYTDLRRRSYDPDPVQTETFAANGRNERLEYQGVLEVATAVQATFGAEREVSRATTSSFGAPAQAGRAELDSGYGQLVVTPFTGLTATGGARYDRHDRFGSATSLAGSVVYSPNDGTTTLRASYSEGFKAPTLYELQGDYGNLLLRPERARGWDAGVTQRAVEGRIEASATYFHRASRDLIDFVSCAAPLSGICVNRPFGTYDNVLRASAEGAELTLDVRPVDPLRLQVNYTYTSAIDRSPGSNTFGNRLARRPAQSVNAVVDYRWSFGLTTGATVTHVGGSFDDAGNTRRLAGYVLADVRATFPVSRLVEIYGRVENLFDEHYETAFGYGTPGRAAYGGIRVSY